MVAHKHTDARPGSRAPSKPMGCRSSVFKWCSCCIFHLPNVLFVLVLSSHCSLLPQWPNFPLGSLMFHLIFILKAHLHARPHTSCDISQYSNAFSSSEKDLCFSLRGTNHRSLTTSAATATVEFLLGPPKLWACPGQGNNYTHCMLLYCI